MNEKLILITDDEPQICAEIAGHLSRKGYQTLIAGNGRDAFDMFVSQHPICVLTDYHMPEMNGLDLLKKIKMIRKDIHVILMSGVADVKTVAAAMKNEAFDFLSKPIDLGELVNLVHLAINKTLLQSRQKIEDTMTAFFFHKTIHGNENISVLYFNRDLDEYTSTKYSNNIAGMINEKLLKINVVFHLENSKYINNIGLNFLIQIKDTLEQSGRKLFICSPVEQVLNYIKTLGYYEYLNMEKNLDDALTTIGGAGDI